MVIALGIVKMIDRSLCVGCAASLDLDVKLNNCDAVASISRWK